MGLVVWDSVGDTLPMWTLWFALVAQGAPTILHVGVHQRAGSTLDIAVDGADGICSVTRTQVTCPASQPVTFRWGPRDSSWVGVGALTLAPGEIGTGWIMGAPEMGEACLGRANEASTNAPESLPGVIRDCSEGVGLDAPHVTSVWLDVLEDHALHPDPEVRMAVMDAMVPLWRHTASDPFPPGSPSLIPEGLIARWASDVHPRVRRRLANRLRESRDPALTDETISALGSLMDDLRPVSRAAMKSVDVLATDERSPGLWAWERAFKRVSREGGPGRAAANTLGHLAETLEPSASVVPADAVGQVLSYHPERAWNVWYAWRDEVPFHRDWVDVLFRETVGLNGRLLEYWSQKNPDELKEAIQAWEPGPQHSERYTQACATLVAAEVLPSGVAFCE